MIPTEFKAMAVLGLLGAVFLALLWVQGVRAERDELRGKLELAEQAVAVYEAEAEAGRKALAAREDEMIRLIAEKTALRRELGELYENDPAARAWADCALPDSVTCLLQQALPPGPAHEPAGGLSADGPGAGTAGQDHRYNGTWSGRRNGGK